MGASTEDAAPRVVVFYGPTASGKSALTLALAARVPVTVINADALQIYHDLKILTARPGLVAEARVPHRLYGVLDGGSPCSAARWRGMAETAVQESLAAGQLPVLCGGTGFYLEALMRGLSAVPEIPETVRAAVRAALQAQGAAALYATLRREDPSMAAILSPTDGQRIARALEVARGTGRSLAAWRRQPPERGVAAGWRFHVVLVAPPRERLYRRCDDRLRRMVADGAIAEVAALRRRDLPPDAPILRALGVAPLSAHLDGLLTLEHSIANAATGTRRYAKRQSTWARHRLVADLVLEGADPEADAERVLTSIGRA